jgi:hypothetical protein
VLLPTRQHDHARFSPTAGAYDETARNLLPAPRPGPQAGRNKPDRDLTRPADGP